MFISGSYPQSISGAPMHNPRTLNNEEKNVTTPTPTTITTPATVTAPPTFSTSISKKSNLPNV